MLKSKIYMLKKIKVYELVEFVFLALLGLYLLFLAEQTTVFNFEYSTDVETFFISSLKIVTVIKIALFFIKIKGGFKENSQFRRKVLIFLFSAVGFRIIYYMVYQQDKYKFLILLGILTLGAIGSDYSKVLKTYSISVGLMIGAAVFASLSGFITNYAYLKKGGVIHSSWGLVYSTDYASVVLLLCIFSWIAWKEITPKLFFVMGLLSILNSAFIARSITSTTIGIAFLVVILLEGIGFKKGRKLTAKLLELVFPVCTLIIFSATFLYHKGNSIGIILNNFFHGRISLLDNGIKNYKLSLFGMPFSQIGSGGSTFHNSNYNFIDSSYGLMLLRYGIVFFVAIMLLWVLMTRKAVKMCHWRLAFGMGLIALHSFSEHHFPEVNYNILIILPFSVLGMGWLVKDKEHFEITMNKNSFSVRNARIGILTTGIVALLVVMGGPYILSLFRTIFDVTSNIEIKNKEKLVCVSFMFMIIVVIVVAVAIYKLLSLIHDKAMDRSVSIRKKIILPLGIVLLVVLGLFTGVFLCKKIIDKKSKLYLEVVETEKNAINAVKSGISESGGRFYADEIPYIYQKMYGCVTDAFLQGDELAGKKSTTVLMDADYESAPLLGMGFLYTEISEKHAVYSNDTSVIRELESAGYHMTGYFSRERKVDLEEEANRNELSMTGDGAILVGENGKALRYGPYYELRSGYYTVKYDLSLPVVNEYQEDYKVCTLLICVNWGDKVAELPVFRRDFDEEGNLCAEKRVKISEARGCEFKVYPEGKNIVLVRGISCRKTPDVDTHNKYDDKGRVIRTEYYDRDGNPINSPDGYHARECEYNSRNLVRIYHFYDTEGNPIANKSGYASIGYKYELKKRIIKETYYGVDGSRLVMEEGQSAVAYGYDSNGNKNEYRYYDTDDNPVMLKGEYSILRLTFDDKKRIVCEEYFDITDNPVIIKGGYSKISYEYDDVDREINICYYGEDGKLVVADAGYAQRYRVLDNEGRELRVEYFNVNGERIAVAGNYAMVEYEYDMYGNRVDAYYYSEFEEPVLYKNIYFHLHRVYNSAHQIISETQYDVEDKAIVFDEGYTTVEKEYDDRGNVAVFRYLDEAGSLVMRKDGYAGLVCLYNEKNQKTKVMYYDVSWNLVVLPAGYSIIEYGYDEIGNQTDTSFYDASGNPAMFWGHFYKSHKIYNGSKQVVREEYLDESSDLMIRNDGFAAIEYEYDLSNHITKEYYLGLNNELVNCKKGYATIEYTYDSDGNLINIKYYDDKGKEVVG